LRRLDAHQRQVEGQLAAVVNLVFGQGHQQAPSLDRRAIQGRAGLGQHGVVQPAQGAHGRGVAGLQPRDQPFQGVILGAGVASVVPAFFRDRTDKHRLGGGQVAHDVAAGVLARPRRPVEPAGGNHAHIVERAAADAREVVGEGGDVCDHVFSFSGATNEFVA
jgi:hypothetical protein